MSTFSVKHFYGQRTGPPGTPVAFETVFGWILAGPTSQPTSESFVPSHHTFIMAGDDLLRRFWEVEENMKCEPNLLPEERSVLQHFEKNHCRAIDGRFIVSLLKKPHAPLLGESRTHAVQRFLPLERSLRSSDEFGTFDSVIQEYFDMKHAEPVPKADLEKTPQDVFYLPMYLCREEGGQYHDKGASSV